jgi:hypothetical protein
VRSNRFLRLWKDLKDEGRRFPWRDALLRMVADLISVTLSLIFAFVLWYAFYVEILRVPGTRALAERFTNFVTGYAPIWGLLALLIFHLHGFYTRTRGYAHRYKALVVFRAVTLFVMAFLFADYFIYRGELFPRGVEKARLDK